jgi:trimethylamine:corrinoid methyltransferase-like protein
MPSDVIDRASYDGWKARGEKSTFERARDRVDKLLPTYQPNNLTDEQRNELREITTQIANKFGMEHLPGLPQGE